MIVQDIKRFITFNQEEQKKNNTTMKKTRAIKSLENLMDNLAEHEIMMEEKHLAEGASIEDIECMRSNYEITQMVLERKYHKLTGQYYKIRNVFGEETA